MSTQLIWQVAALTHVGKVRKENQDCLLVDGWITQSSGSMTLTQRALTDLPSLFAVFDGMGGHSAGALASRTAAHGLAQAASPLRPGYKTEELDVAVAEANQEVMSFARNLSGHHDMGTTLAGVLVSSEMVLIFNAGDASVYRMSGDYLGLLSERDRVPDPTGVRNGLVSQWLGGVEERQLDIHALEIPVEAGLMLLLCSDGLDDFVSTAQIAEELKAVDEGPSGLHNACQTLLRLAFEAGAPDNISIILVRLAEDREAS
jgi:serine/threonine protein phosphatase PrpC